MVIARPNYSGQINLGVKWVKVPQNTTCSLKDHLNKLSPEYGQNFLRIFYGENVP